MEQLFAFASVLVVIVGLPVVLALVTARRAPVIEKGNQEGVRPSVPPPWETVKDGRANATTPPPPPPPSGPGFFPIPLAHRCCCRCEFHYGHDEVR